MLLRAIPGVGAVYTFFNAGQIATNVASGSTSDTIQCLNYRFQHSMDKWWYPGIGLGPGEPTGRYLRVNLPEGLEAQCVTASPTGYNTNGAKALIVIRRADGGIFNLTSFSAKLLANTWGAGGSFEVMPKRNGEDGFPDPVMFDASGVAGHVFSYQCPTLVGFDSYDIVLYVDFALTAVTVADDTVPPAPQLFITPAPSNQVKLSWPGDADGFWVQASPVLDGASFTNVTAQPVLENGSFSVTLPAAEGPCFFRLSN